MEIFAMFDLKYFAKLKLIFLFLAKNLNLKFVYTYHDKF